MLSRIPPLRASAVPRRIGLAVVVALHAAILAALLTHAPARKALLSVAPIMVEFITPPPRIEEAPKPPPIPQVEPPKPRPAVKPVVKPVAKPVQRVVETPPILTAPAEAPSPIVAPQAPPEPPAPMAPTAVAAPPSPAPAAMTQPIFNADYLENPSPAYPPVSRRNGEQGRVMLRVLVSAKGTAEDIQVRTSSGFQRLDDSARDTVSRWKFVPAKRGTEPVSAWVLIPISFRLEG